MYSHITFVETMPCPELDTGVMIIDEASGAGGSTCLRTCPYKILENSIEC